MAIKANSRIRFDSGWWKKECPKDLFRVKEFTRFIDAMDDFGGAERRLDIQAGDDQLDATDLAELRKAKDLIGKIDKPRKEFLKYCEDLATDLKKAKDKKLQEDKKTYDILVKLLKTNVPAAVDDFREMLDSFDGDPVGAPMVTPASHAAYLKRLMPRLKRLPFNFGFALVSQEPTDQRFQFHNKKAPRSLANSLKNDVQPRKLTWGEAFGGGIYPDGDYPAATLVLVVHGPMVPSFARRVRVSLKAFGLSMFNNIVVVKDGQLEESKDGEGDEIPNEEIVADNLDALDLEVAETEDPNVVKSSLTQEEYQNIQEAKRVELGEIPAPPPPPPPQAPKAPPPPPPPQGARPAPKPAPQLSPELLVEHKAWIKVRSGIAKKVARCIHEKWGPFKKVEVLWKRSNDYAKDGVHDSAIKGARSIEKMLAGYEPGAEGPKEEYERLKPDFEKQLGACIKERKGDLESMRVFWANAKMSAEMGNYAMAIKFLKELGKCIAEKDLPPKEEVPVDPVERRQLRDDLLDKLASIEESLEDALEKLKENDEKSGKKMDRPVDSLKQKVRDALYAHDPNFAETEKEKFAFREAEANLQQLANFIKDAKKAGYKAQKTIDMVRKTAGELDQRVGKLAHLVDEESLKKAFKKNSKARARFAKFLRKDDLFGAVPKLKPWESAVSNLESEASKAGLS